MQQVVRLLGDLGERYGTEHTYHDLRTPADAIKLLCINLPELQEELIHAHEHGVGYRLIQADVDLGYDDLALPLGSNDLILTPVVTGSGGGGVGQVLAGVGLVAFAVLTAGVGAGFLGAGLGLTAGTFTLGAAASTAIGAIGTSLVLGGVAQMLSPQPTVPTIGGFNGPSRMSSADATSTDGPQSVVRGSDGRQSYLFSGAANTVGVGATIPVVYGEVITGSHLLSARVQVADDSDPLKTSIKEPGQQTMLLGGEKLTYGITTVSGVKAARTNKTFYTNTSPGHRTKVVNTDLNLVNGTEVNLGSIGEFGAYREQCDIVFELPYGLYDYVSGPGSTLVDGYITYRIELIVSVDDPPDFVGGNSQATIQGLLNPGQPYRWVHRLEHSQVSNIDDVYFKIQIVDSRAASGIRLRAHAFGFGLI
jgi:predicted phage tail protein